jgi:hypothetical protein
MWSSVTGSSGPYQRQHCSMIASQSMFPESGNRFRDMRKIKT